MGLEVAIDKAAGVFVDVLWWRLQGKDDEALKLLNNVQVEILNHSVCPIFLLSDC